MSKYVSLSPAGLPKEFDLEVHSEKPIITVEEKENSIEVNYIFPGFTVGDNEQQMDDQSLPFKEIGISGAGFISESGKPLLPSFGRYVQIPPGYDYQVIVHKGKPMKFDDILITPAQEKATDQAGVEEEFEYDAQAYKDDTLYPAELVDVGNTQNMNDYKVLLIHVRPLQYNAAKRQLIGYSNIKLTIKLKKKEVDTEKSGEFFLTDPGANREGFGNLVLNPSRHIEERISLPPIPEPIHFKPRGPEFLIIYENNLKKAADALANWKHRKGMVTETVSIETIGNSVNNIKAHIRGIRQYFLSRLRYVLLLGDTRAIVTEQRGGATTDHYYYTPKDPDGNGCVLPWISGGRIPVNNLTEAMCVISQIIDYERNPPCDPDYYRRITLAAYFQDNNPQDGRADRAYMMTMEKIREHMTSLGFFVERAYVSNNPNPQSFKDGTLVPQEVRDSIVPSDEATDMLISETSEGQLLIGHRDHGGDDGWYEPPFQVRHLSSILSPQPSIFYSINCLTGRFDSNARDCFAEVMLKLMGGAPSLIAATELSNTWRNDSLMKAMFDAMWPGMIPTFPGSTASYPIKHNRIGDILNYAKSYLLVEHGDNSGTRNHLEIYHIVGDPTLELWSDAPIPLRLKTIMLRDRLNINLNLVPTNGVVTIWYRGKLVKRMAISSTRMSIPLRDFKLEPICVPVFRNYLEICAAAPGHRYTQSRVLLPRR